MFNRLMHFGKKPLDTKLTLLVLQNIYATRNLKLFKSLINSYHDTVTHMLDTISRGEEDRVSNPEDYVITSLLLESWYQHWNLNGFDSESSELLKYISCIYPVHLLSAVPRAEHEASDGIFVKMERSPYPDKFGAAEPVVLPWLNPLFNIEKPYIFLNTLKREYKLLIIKDLIHNLKSPSKLFNTPFYKVLNNINTMSYNFVSITDLGFTSNEYKTTFLEHINKVHRQPRFFATSALAIKPVDYIDSAQDITSFSKDITLMDEINKLKHRTDITPSDREIRSFCNFSRLNTSIVVQLNMAFLDIHKPHEIDVKDRILTLLKLLITEIDQLDTFEQDAYQKLFSSYANNNTYGFTILEGCFLIAMHNIIVISGSTDYDFQSINDAVYKLLTSTYPEHASKLSTLASLNLPSYSALKSLVYMDVVPKMELDSTNVLPSFV